MFDLVIHYPTHTNRDDETLETLSLNEVRAEVLDLHETYENLPLPEKPTFKLIWDDAQYRETLSMTNILALVDQLEDIMRAGNLGETEIAAYYRQWNQWPSTDVIMYNINPIGNYAESEPVALLGRYAAENEIFTDDAGKPLDSKVIEYLDFSAVGRHVGGHVYTIDGTTWWEPLV